VLLPRYEHGWPWAHTVRQEKWFLGGFFEPTASNCWRFWDIAKQDEFRAGSLAGNVAFGLAIALLTGCLFEVWRRRHRSLFQIHLLDVGLAMTSVAGLLGWYVSMRTVHERERTACNAHLDEMTENGRLRYAMSDYVEKERRGPTWIRLCLGDQRFEVLDRVIVAAPLREQGVSTLLPFRELRKTSVECRDLQELAQLGQLRQLEELDLTLRIRTSEDSIQLPRFSDLRVLTIRSLENRPAGLDQLTNLRVLDLRAAYVSNASLQEIGHLPKLRKLSLAYSSLPPEEFRHLQPLTELEDLDLDQTIVQEGAIRWLAKLPALKKLSLRRSRLTDELLAIIAQSSSLELLLLDDLTEEGLRNLTSSPGLGRIQVSYPDRAALSWPEHIHGWRISSHMGDGSWYFTREVRKERKAKE
jgi:hypothetical protein